MKEITTGILLQGNIRGWTIPIIEEYQQNFPDSEILLSTWDNENISNIPCKVIQSPIPDVADSHMGTKNYQIIGSRSGLKEMKSNLILKTRTDMFVHNPNILKIFLAENTEKKIMYPYIGFSKEFRNYWINDFCQLSSRETLLNYWNSMPLHDGSDHKIPNSLRVSAEIYLTQNYILNVCNDGKPWSVTHDEYFIKKRYHEDFQLEWEKTAFLESYQNFVLDASIGSVSDNKLFTLSDVIN